jgi:signal recognition particle subunit SRP54
MMQKMGPLEGIIGMIPGASKLKGLAGAMDDKKLKKIEAIVLSMTPKERSRPEILNGKRRSRIAKGSGNSVTQVNQFLKQFGQMRKMMKSKGKMKKMLSQLGGSGMDLGGLGGDFPKGMKF